MAVEDLCPPSSEICTVPNSESPEPDVELGCSPKKKKNKKKRCKLESNDKSCESPSLQSQFVQLSDQAPQPLTEKSNTITDSENPQSNVEPSLSTKKKKKKKKGSRTTETNDTSCESPSQQPQLVQLSDQQAPQPLAEKITTITDSESRQSNVELSLSQNKKKKKKNKRKNKKGCKTPETNDKSCESPSIQPQLVQATDQEVEVPQRIEAVQPQLAQVTDQKLEVPQPIEDSSFSVKNKKRNGKKSRKPHDCNDEVCGVSVGTSVMESNMPAVDPYIKPSVEISLEQLVAEPLVEGMSTTANSKSPKPNADFGCSQEMKKKKQKRSHKTSEYKELLVETMMPEADPSFQPSIAMFSEQELEVSQPLNVDAESLVEGMSTTINSERPRPNADFNCSQETKKKKRKRGHKTSDSKEVFVEPMLPEAESSLRPSLTMLSEQELDVPQPLNADAEPLVEEMSTTINSESTRGNADFTCSQETKKKKRKRGSKTSDSKELLVEVVTPEADPSLQPLLAIFSEHELEVPPPLTTDAEPLVEGMSMTMNSESLKPNADISCLEETKKKNSKRKCKTSVSKKLSVEIMMPEPDPSLQPTLSEKELEVSQPLNTDAEPLVEGMSTTMNSESPKPNADFSCPQETKKKNRKRKHKTSESKELLVEIMAPEEDPSLQPTLSEKELQVPPPLNTDAEPLVEGMSTTINLESTRGNADFTCSQETKKKKRKRGSKTSDSKELLVEVVTPEADPSLQPLLAIFSEHELEVPPPLTTDAEPLVEGTSMTMNSESLKPNADISCLEETKKKNSKRKCKTSVSKKLSVEIMMPEPDPSLQPTLSEKELEVPQPLNTDAEPLVEGMSTTMNPESPKPNADFSCPQETKKKNRKRKHKTSESKELLVEIMAPEEDPSLQPTLSEKELQVPPPLNTDAEPLVEGMSTTINLESTRGNADFTCSQETKKKKRKRGSKTSDSKELLVEVVTPEADPSLQPLLAIFSEHELEVPPPLTTDAEPLVEGTSMTMNSESLKPNADISCLEETKKKNSKRKCKTSVSKKLSVEIMMPEPDPSLQPTLSEKELEVPQPLNTDAEPLVEGMSTTMNPESPKPNADFSCPQETKKKNRKRKHKTSESKELLVEIMAPEEDPSLQPTLSEKELQVPPPLNTDAEPLVEGMSTTINLESTRGNADFTCSQETKKKKQKRGSKASEHKELLVEIMTPETDPSLQPSLAIISEQEVEVPQPLNTDAQPLVEGVSTTNSESPKPNAEFSCSQETKKKNPKRNRKTNENKELLVETMTPEADLSLQPPLAIFSEQEVEVVQPLNTGTVWKETKIDEVPSLSHLTPKADTEVVAIGREGNLSQKKLLILDINGLLADIVQMEVSIPSSFKPDTIISRKAVFKRPFCDDFLQFCFDRFNVGVWSSRTKENVNSVIDFLLGDSKHKLLFCWNQSHCTSTSFKTVENKNKPLVLKELRKLWEKLEPDLPWARGEYNESNTVLLDDSPHKALCNPVNTAIFPNSYQFRNRKDSSLGPGGDIRSYLEGLAMAESAQKYVEQNPFGQRPITKSNPSWNFYRRVIEDVKPLR